MSLIKPVILVISIILTNGNIVTYELSDSFYSQSIRFVNPEEGLIELITLHNLYADSIYIIEVYSSQHKIRHKSVSPIHEDKHNFSNFLIPFNANDFNGLKITYNDTSGINVGHFYVQVEQLKELYNLDEISDVLPLVGDSFIHAYSDVCDPSIRNLVMPKELHVEWKKSFSNTVSDWIEQVGINSSNE